MGRTDLLGGRGFDRRHDQAVVGESCGDVLERGRIERRQVREPVPSGNG